MPNSHLNVKQYGKNKDNDEFYTPRDFIDHQLEYYTEHLRGKHVYCNCDDPTKSEFVHYFRDNFNRLGISRLTATHYIPDAPLFDSPENLLAKPLHLIKKNGMSEEHHRLMGNGSFDSPECLEQLKRADIIITNPPFSKLRWFFTILMHHRKDFLLVIPQHTLTRIRVYPYLRDKRIRPGYEFPDAVNFVRPDGSIMSMRMCAWLTTLPVPKSIREFPVRYDPEKHPKHDNTDIIKVSGGLKNVPGDWEGWMSLSIYNWRILNPEQFVFYRQTDKRLYTNGNKEFDRLIIRHLRTE